MDRLVTLLEGLISRRVARAGVPGHARFKEGLLTLATVTYWRLLCSRPSASYSTLMVHLTSYNHVLRVTHQKVAGLEL